MRVSNPESSIQPLVDRIGLPTVVLEPDQDPFRTLDELMVVVEALCPVWPDRPTFEHSTIFLL